MGLLLLTIAIAALLGRVLLRASPPPHDAVAQKRPTTTRYFERILRHEQDMSKFAGEQAGYSWSQTEAEVEVVVPVAAELRAADVACRIQPGAVSLTCGGRVILQVEPRAGPADSRAARRRRSPRG